MEKFEDTIYVKEVQFNVTGLYTKGRNIPDAYSHDDPAFSDAGESAHIDEMDIYIGSQEVNEVITDEVKSEIYEKVLEELD